MKYILFLSIILSINIILYYLYQTNKQLSISNYYNISSKADVNKINLFKNNNSLLFYNKSNTFDSEYNNYYFDYDNRKDTRILQSNSTNYCSKSIDCYNCSMSTTIDNNCLWDKNSCVSNKNNKYSIYFYQTFSQCTKNQDSLSIMQNYCGPLIRTMPFTSSPVKINNLYMAKNMYCRIKGLNLDPTKIISFNLTKHTSNILDDYAVEIFYYDGSSKYALIKDSYFIKQEIGVESIVFHYFSQNVLKNVPYIAIFDYIDYNTSNYLGLIIAVVVIVLMCLICSIFFWKCSKNLMESNRKREEERLRIQAANIALMNNPNNTNTTNIGLNNRTQAQLELDKKKNKLKNALKKLFESDLKPKSYKEEFGEFNTECTICLEEFTDKSVITTLLCKHVYHFDCIKDWIKKQRGDMKCPNCNVKIIPEKYIDDSIDKIDIADETNNRNSNSNNLNNPNNEASNNVNNINNNNENNISPQRRESNRLILNNNNVTVRNNFVSNQLNFNNRVISQSLDTRININNLNNNINNHHITNQDARNTIQNISNNIVNTNNNNVNTNIPSTLRNLNEPRINLYNNSVYRLN